MQIDHVLKFVFITTVPIYTLHVLIVIRCKPKKKNCLNSLMFSFLSVGRTAGFCALCALQNHVMNALQSTGKILSPLPLVKNLRCMDVSYIINDIMLEI